MSSLRFNACVQVDTALRALTENNLQSIPYSTSQSCCHCQAHRNTVKFHEVKPIESRKLTSVTTLPLIAPVVDALWWDPNLSSSGSITHLHHWNSATSPSYPHAMVKTHKSKLLGNYVIQVRSSISDPNRQTHHFTAFRMKFSSHRHWTTINVPGIVGIVWKRK